MASIFTNIIIIFSKNYRNVVISLHYYYYYRRYIFFIDSFTMFGKKNSKIELLVSSIWRIIFCKNIIKLLSIYKLW